MDWEEVESKNPKMLSFVNDQPALRLNVYFTTMTVTVQSPKTGCLTFRNVDEKRFEEILEDHYE